ncbi:hypothetical protein VC83_02484 [Pseudogymnoascus destructans]|uniref:Uncharacterized protein n=1 Tax=Pseudogymnoascus destructans TaxID=655981 RepID=A0A177AGZ5_9PEZI|nr:uncharacterized protein VC83_02484 [Pseudogymnoascus destructans]OAF61060.1 hypothetical protein VC83_02484 [Pseudogymnoascus destructans]
MKSVFTAARGPSPEENNIGVTIAPNVPGINGKSSDGKSRFKTLSAFTDNASYKQFDPETLEPLGVASQGSLHPALAGPLSAAHANYDPVNGDVLNHNLTFGLNSVYRVFKTIGRLKTELVHETNPVQLGALSSRCLPLRALFYCSSQRGRDVPSLQDLVRRRPACATRHTSGLYR